MIADCAAFEHALVEALAGPRGSVSPRLAALRDHAQGCGACRASLPLVALAAIPPEERAPIPQPTEHDWARFDRALQARLEAERSTGWGIAAAAVAAVLAGVVLGAWLLRAPDTPLIAEGPKPAPPGAASPEPPQAKPQKPGPPAEDPELEPIRSDPWTARGLAEDDDDAFEDGPFPILEKLDKPSLERLERWLDEEEARLSPRGEA